MNRWTLEHLDRLKQACDATGQCGEYQMLLQTEISESQKMTAYLEQTTLESPQYALTWGAATIILIGIAVIAVPFIGSLKKPAAVLLSKLTIIIPTLAALAFVALVFITNICYKDCSDQEVGGRVISLLVVLGAAVLATITLHKRDKRQSMKKKLAQSKPLLWILLGLILIVLSILYSSRLYSMQQQSYEYDKQTLHSLREYEQVLREHEQYLLERET